MDFLHMQEKRPDTLCGSPSAQEIHGADQTVGVPGNAKRLLGLKNVRENFRRKNLAANGQRQSNNFGISAEQALKYLELEDFSEMMCLFRKAYEQKIKCSSNTVSACSIINAKCGSCPENCAFCAQSNRSKAKIDAYPLVSVETMVEQARKASEQGSVRYGIVTSGRTVGKGRELDQICRAVSLIARDLPIKPCASLGILDLESLKQLKEAGLTRYHHNLETAESYFKVICSTRNYKDQTDTVGNARKAGLSVCSGGIFGLGESKAQRVELLETIRGLEVDSVPVNFLNPIPGTPLEDMKQLTPFECLKIIAVARLMLPETNIRICGGREFNLRDFQSWIFLAGADAVMTGGYLVTSGRDVKIDMQMISDAGMRLDDGSPFA
jgi:biotin synthase